ncbi:hypothetical protein JW948_14350 [bacterium]|nr:hypothetical protein [bacterium]
MKKILHQNCGLSIAGLIVIFVSCTSNRPAHDYSMDLSGTWRFGLDSTRTGIPAKWTNRPLGDRILLPGTLDENGRGLPQTDSTDLHLNRIIRYTGPAWFRKEVRIPASWGNRSVELVMERTKVSHVWLDSVDMGTNRTLFSEQVYDLTAHAAPGRHILTIMIDNDPGLVPVAGSHAYAEDTQTNWNGILGKIQLRALNPDRVTDLFIDPDIHQNQVRLRMRLHHNGPGRKHRSLVFRALSRNVRNVHRVPENVIELGAVPADTLIEAVYSIGDRMRLWSETDPVLYELTVLLMENGRILDRQTENFGMRKFGTRGTQFTINDRITILRGKQDACVFPLTGYPPMEKDGWIRVFQIARQYGLNHYRFHSWCPPEAAFEAADICGFYLQPELPIWWGFRAHDSSQVAFMMEEGRRILDAYGNHPSFVMFALGNEIWEDRDVLRDMVGGLRAHDGRPLYAQGSNNRLSNPSYAEGDDYWTTFRTDVEKPDLSSDVRASVSFLDSKLGEGGIINTLPPSGSRTYSRAIQNSPVPVIGHEIGQYQVYPDYAAELPKYTGVLKPWNLELFRDRLAAAGMQDQAFDFFRASGALSVICYREEIEMAIRTPGFGGFQLLDLQDYPGQGTALVGLLDAFMDSKGLIAPEEFRNFCDDVVILPVIDRYVWENDETLTVLIQVANYSPEVLGDSLLMWRIVTNKGKQIGSGEIRFPAVKQGGITDIGRIRLPLSGIGRAVRLNLHVSLPVADKYSQVPLWIYPPDVPIRTDHVHITDEPDGEALSVLDSGGAVLLFPDVGSIEANSVTGQFIPDFWNWAMFRSLAEQYGGRPSPGTLGLLMDPDHPVFKDFPTDFHANWQWWTIVRNSRPMILDSLETGFRPVIQMIDNINRNHKLGLLFECRVGRGRLVVCTAGLPAIQSEPSARQLYYSLLNYMNSERFNPEYELSTRDLKRLLSGKTKSRSE